MPIPLNFLKATAKAIVKYGGNAVGFGLAGDLLVDFAFPIVEDIWDAWGKKTNDEERRGEIEAVAQASPKAVAVQVAKIVQEVASDRPVESQQMLATYLTQVPAMVQNSLRRQSDPTGRSVSANLTPRKAEDLLALLPTKLPRFKSGDHPLPGVDWELETLLGVGGFGEVWKARNPDFDGVAPVALKFCLDVKAKNLLRHEAAILNQVMSMRHGKWHRGFVQLRQTHLNADPPCLEYEYIEDGDLAGIIKEKTLKTDEAAKIMLELAGIVGFAHRLKPPVVHRDLKPANILVRQTTDGTINLKVADFGIGGLAVSQAIGETSRGTSRGHLPVSALQGAYTPLYASPQQMRGEDPDPRDDVFSLGVIWYQMLTGKLSSGPSLGAQWKKRFSEQGMSSAMIDLMVRCFEDERDDRPVDAADLAQAIRKQLSDGHGGTAPGLFDAINTGPGPIEGGTKSKNEHPEPIPPGADASGWSAVVPLIVNDHYNIWRKKKRKVYNGWLTEEMCKGYVVIIKCVELEGNPSFRFVPFDDRSGNGMKMSDDAHQRSQWKEIQWHQIGKFASGKQTVTVQICYRVEPL